MKLASYNCKNIKTNQLMVQKLLDEFDIVFLTEHWLKPNEQSIINNLSSNFRVIFHSDMAPVAPNNALHRVGRPFGGICWLIKNDIEVLSFERFNSATSMIKIRVGLNDVFIFGVWIPFDNGTSERLASFQSNLALLESYVKFEAKDEPVLIMGDFNCDLNRKNRFDQLLQSFISVNNFFDSISFFDQEIFYTYENGDYRSTIDHFLCNLNFFKNVVGSKIINDCENLSDHNPISLEFNIVNKASMNEEIKTQTQECKKFHFFNWKNVQFREIYKSILSGRLSDLVSRHGLDENPNIEQIKTVYSDLCSIFLKSAREAETELGIKNKKIGLKFKNTQMPKTKEMSDCIANIKLYQDLLRNSNYSNLAAKLNLKFYRKNLKEMQKFYLLKVNQSKSFLLDRLIKEKNDKFWKDISKFRRESKSKDLVISKLKLEDFAEFYGNLFSHSDRPSGEQQRAIEKEVYDFSLSLVGLKCDPHFFSNDEIAKVISDLNTNIACGNDGILNEFVKFGKSEILVALFNWFFNAIIVTGYIPDEFNVSLVTPIPKKSEILSPGDARPISISSVMANLLEALILDKSFFLRNTSINQLGYKSNTSCKHAFFLVNEVINYYTSGKSPMYIASLDATKAFDKLWRAGMFYKLKNRMHPGLWRVLYTYYTKSMIIVKYNGQRSELIRTTEGVKQGGILSPFLFNFFINDLLTECLSQNIGAKIGDSNLSIIGYCDDLILLSPVAKHIELLLKTCELFANKWKMEFNAKKSVSLVMGKGIVENPAFKISGVELPEVDNFTYLGLCISKSLNFDYFDEKMKKVERSFYSLHSLGCKPRHLSPHSIGFVYKQYCQSIFKYGLECLYLPDYKLKEYNIRQNILLKHSIGLSKHSVSTPLLNVLKVEKISEIYCKYKLFFYKQLMMNGLTRNVFNELKEHYANKICPKTSYIKQLANVDLQVGFSTSMECIKKSLFILSEKFKCKNQGLCDSLNFVLNELHDHRLNDDIYNKTRHTLSLLLYS